MLLMQPNLLSSFDGELKEDFIMLVDAIVSYSSSHDLLHVLAIAVHIYHSQPVLNPNHHHIHIFPQLYAALLAHLQILQLEYCGLAPLHAGH